MTRPDVDNLADVERLPRRYGDDPHPLDTPLLQVVAAPQVRG